MTDIASTPDGEGVDRVIGVGDPQRVGRFRFTLDGHRWEWSESVAQMHGYQDGEVTPTTELLMSHKHPDDRDRVAAVLDKVAGGEPFSSRHRIIDRQGRTHTVVVIGDRIRSPDGAVTGTSGFYVDVTASLQLDVSAAVTDISLSRAEIEQAKGVLMAMYGIDADRAFDVLVWRSQETNIKVRELACRLMATVRRLHIPTDTQDELSRIMLSLN